MLNPQLESEDLITNSHISLSGYSSIQPSTINISNLSSSTSALYQEYQRKLTGDHISESMINISSILESDRPQPPKLSNTKKYQPIPLFSAPVKTVRQYKAHVESNSIIEFELQPPFIKSVQSKNQFSFSNKMLQTLNIETTLVENYDKLRKQLKKQDFVNYNDYKVIIPKLEVKLYSIKDILLKKRSKLEKLILMGKNSLNAVPKTNCDTEKYNDTTLKLKYNKVFKKHMRIKF